MESTCDDGKGKAGRSGGDLESGAVSEYMHATRSRRLRSDTLHTSITINNIEDK
jgi:hypothetical protein